MSESGKLTSDILESITGGAICTVQNDTVDFANIREKPGLSSKVLLSVKNGNEVTTTGRVISKDGYDWHEIKLEGENSTGWIAGSLIGY